MLVKSLIGVALSLILGINFSCKKDYGNDIPNWVKKDIRESKRQQAACMECNTYNPREVYEYTDVNYGIVYAYLETFNSGTETIITYFDATKLEICSSGFSGICTGQLSFSPQYERLIYKIKSN